MDKRNALITTLTLGLALLAGSAALAQRDLTGTTVTSKVIMTCPAVVQAKVYTIEDNWLQTTSQGWLSHGEIVSSATGSMLRCWYGADKADPARNPQFSVHKMIPAGNANCSIPDPKVGALTCPQAAPGSR